MRCCRSTPPSPPAPVSDSRCVARSSRRTAGVSASPTAKAAARWSPCGCLESGGPGAGGAAAPCTGAQRLGRARLAPWTAAVGAPLACAGRSLRVGGMGSGGRLRGGGDVQRLEVAAELAPERRVTQCILHRRLQIPELAATVVPLAFEAVRVHRLLPHQRSDAVGELDLPARATTDALEVLEDRRREHVAADHGEARGCDGGLRLLDYAAH